jgi:hypothetical protein
MRLYEINQGTVFSWERVKAFVEKNCQPYIKQNPDWELYPLYRGIKPLIPKLTITKFPVNRRPRDTSDKAHQMMNAAFDKFGFKAHRGNSMFCTGSREIATYYGTVHQVIPIGDFAFTWSKTVDDLFTYLENQDDDEDRLSSPESFEDFVKDNYINNTDLRGAILSKNEVMLTGSKALIVNW